MSDKRWWSDAIRIRELVTDFFAIVIVLPLDNNRGSFTPADWTGRQRNIGNTFRKSIVNF